MVAGSVVLASNRGFGSVLCWIAGFMVSVEQWTNPYRQTLPYRAMAPIVRIAELRLSSLRFPWLQAASILPLAAVAWELHKSWLQLQTHSDWTEARPERPGFLF